MNISSSVVTPPSSGQASHRPSKKPALESQKVSSGSPDVVVPHTSPLCGPSMQAASLAAHGAPSAWGGRGGGAKGDVERRFTSAGWVAPLSYRLQYLYRRWLPTELDSATGGSK